jgi:hypothetical protein
MKIAIYGDSFGVSPSVKRKDPWYNILADMFDADVKSFAHPGSSNFYNYNNFLKYNQDFDLNIFIHTSSLKYPVPVKLSNINGKSFENMWPSSLSAVEFYRDEWFEGPMDQMSKEFLNQLAAWYIVSDDSFMSLTVELMMNDMESRRPNTIFLASFPYNSTWENNPYYNTTKRNRTEKLGIRFIDFVRSQSRGLGIQGEEHTWQENLEIMSCHFTPETNALFAQAVKNFIDTGKLTPPPDKIDHLYGVEYYFIKSK